MKTSSQLTSIDSAIARLQSKEDQKHSAAQVQKYNKRPKKINHKANYKKIRVPRQKKVRYPVSAYAGGRFHWLKPVKEIDTSNYVLCERRFNPNRRIKHPRFQPYTRSIYVSPLAKSIQDIFSSYEPETAYNRIGETDNTMNPPSNEKKMFIQLNSLNKEEKKRVLNILYSSTSSIDNYMD
jgi:hypothetical protein